MGTENYNLVEDICKRIFVHQLLAIILDKNKPRYHPDAIGNEHLASGSTPYGWELIGNYLNHTCPFHPTTNMNGNNIKIQGITEKGEPMDTFYICRTPGCKHEKVKINNVIDLWMVLVKNIPPSELYVTDKEIFQETLQELAELCGIPYQVRKSSGTQHFTEEEKQEYLAGKAIEEAIDLYHAHLLDEKDEYAKKALDYIFYERAFLSIFIDDEFEQEMVKTWVDYTPDEILAAIADLKSDIHQENPREDEFLETKPLKALIAAEARKRATAFVVKRKYGYAPGQAGWTWMYNRLKGKYKDEVLVHAGIIGIDPKTKKAYDRYYGRWVIGKVFQRRYNNIYGRATWNGIEKSKRHYKRQSFTPTPLNYDKAVTYKRVGLVEGEIDTEALIALGMDHFMDSGGTSGFTSKFVDEHLVPLRDRSTERVQEFILAGDADLPGQSANISIGKLLRDRGFPVRIMILTEGDVGDYVSKYGAQAKEKLQQLENESISYEAFFILYSIARLPKHSFADKKAAMAYIRPYATCLEPDEVYFVAKEVAHHLGEPDSFVDYLLVAWQLLSHEASIGFQESVKSPWILLTADPVAYQLFKAKFHLPSVLVKNKELLFSELMAHNEGASSPLVNIAMDSTLSEELLSFQQSLPNIKWQLCEVLPEELEQIDGKELKSRFKKA